MAIEWVGWSFDMECSPRHGPLNHCKLDVHMLSGAKSATRMSVLCSGFDGWAGLLRGQRVIAHSSLLRCKGGALHCTTINSCSLAFFLSFSPSGRRLIERRLSSAGHVISKCTPSVLWSDSWCVVLPAVSGQPCRTHDAWSCQVCRIGSHYRLVLPTL